MLEFLPPPTAAPTTGPEPDCVRELSADEIQSYVKPHYDQSGNSLPNPAVSVFLGAIRGGKIVGAIGLQLRLHAQPLMIERGHSPVVLSLVAGAEEYILKKTGPQWVYLFAPAGHMSQMAQSMGMQLEPWVVLSKLVMPTAPTRDTAVEFMPVDGLEEESNVVIRPEQHDEDSGE